jgi:hydroxypyruvate reductase
VNADDRRILVHRCITAAVRAVHAGALVRASLASGALAGIDRARPPVVLAAGKAAVSMTEHVLDWFDGPVQGGMVSAPRVPGTPLGPLRTFAAGHPHPTDQSVAAAAAALVAVRELTVEDQVVVLLSGGASALLALPAPPVTLADKVAVTHRLLTRGVAIDGLNAVRKHVSLIKGGQLAMATAARTWTLALSDVSRPVDDDPATIGSGPTVGDPTTFADAWAVLEATGPDWRVHLPRVAERLSAGLRGEVPETPKPATPAFGRSCYRVIGNRHTAAGAAAREATRAGLASATIGPAVQGEARAAASKFLDEALSRAAGAGRPCAVVATGETTVTVTGTGLGGRNQEFVLAAALELARRGLTATVASVGTDGVDGPTDAAGAIADERTSAQAAVRGLDAQALLANNDAYHFFAPLDALLRVPVTDTNVGDVMLLLLG